LILYLECETNFDTPARTRVRLLDATTVVAFFRKTGRLFFIAARGLLFTATTILLQANFFLRPK
jgi:hypothetical protein